MRNAFTSIILTFRQPRRNTSQDERGSEFTEKRRFKKVKATHIDITARYVFEDYNYADLGTNIVFISKLYDCVQNRHPVC